MTLKNKTTSLLRKKIANKYLFFFFLVIILLSALFFFLFSNRHNLQKTFCNLTGGKYVWTFGETSADQCAAGWECDPATIYKCQY